MPPSYLTFKNIKAAAVGSYLSRQVGWVYIRSFDPVRERVYIRANTKAPLYLHLTGKCAGILLDLSARYDLWDITLHHERNRDLTIRVMGLKRDTWVPTPEGGYARKRRLR